jgi:hypothetical protein
MTTPRTDQHTEPSVAQPVDTTPAIAPPGVAIQIDEDWRYNDGQVRRFQGTKRGTEFHVDIIGWQDRDGSIVRHAVIDRDIVIDSTAATRELAAELLAAADEIDALAE